MKTHTQEKHDNQAEYLIKMQKPLGHDSWWYTNRSSEDCINVKMHSWPDMDKITALISDKERATIEVLGLDLEEFILREQWHIINQAAEDLAEDIKIENRDGCSVTGVNYGGRSGGWACVVFDFDNTGDYCEGYEYAEQMYKDGDINKKEWTEWCREADKAMQYITDVHEEVKKLHKLLEAYIEDPETYIEQAREYIAMSIDNEKESITRSADKLATLAS